MSQSQDPHPESIQAAIRQTKPFRSRSQEAVIGLMLTAEAIRWPHQDMLVSGHGLTLQQYNVLRILRGAGAKGLPTLEIAARMIERAPGITRMIDRLEKKALVERHRSHQDRRQVMCRLTAEGTALVRRLDRPIDAMNQRVMGSLSDKEQAQLVRLLNKVRNGAGVQPASTPAAPIQPAPH